MSYLLFIDDPPTAEIYSLSLHDALPISVVSRAARGLADYLLNTLSLAEPLVVIGFDARNGSRSFAERSAAIMTAAGCRVQLLEQPGPTPLVAFGVRQLSADAGGGVTAPHTPPAAHAA